MKFHRIASSLTFLGNYKKTQKISINLIDVLMTAFA